MATALLAPNVQMNETRVLGGEVALDGSNPTVIDTGRLRGIVSVAVSLRSSPAPGLNTSQLTYDLVGRTLHVYAWKPTSATNPTLIASTGTETISYTIVGY
jgi:hypothetical protein